MRLGETLYVVLDENNEITGNGGSPAIYYDRYTAQEMIRDGRLFGESFEVVEVTMQRSEDSIAHY